MMDQATCPELRAASQVPKRKRSGAARAFRGVFTLVLLLGVAFLAGVLVFSGALNSTFDNIIKGSTTDGLVRPNGVESFSAGAGGVLLGCTELELLIKQADVDLPVFPCTTLHVEAALDRALS